MANSLQRLIGRVANAVERFRGTRTFELRLNNRTSHYSVTLDNDFHFTVECDEITAICWYTSFWSLPRVNYVYRVTCRLPTDAPLFYVEKFSRVRYYPLMTGKFCTNEYRKKTAVKAFMDEILKSHSQENAPTVPG